MKIGIISDVHSNIQALNAVMSKFDEEKVEKIICCGDIIGIGINPEETIQALMKKKEMLDAVLGNHEQYYLHGLPEQIHDDKRKMSKDEIANHKWIHSQISEQSKAFLETIKMQQKITVAGKKLYIVHYPMEENKTYKKLIKKPTLEENKEMFKGIDADIYLYGHTHTASVNSENNKWYINPGSLGCPKGSDIAKAGILEIENDKIGYREINVKYNVSEIIEEINKLKFPFYEGILKIFYGK